MLAHHIVHRVLYGRFPRWYHRTAKHTSDGGGDSTTTSSLLNDMEMNSENNNKNNTKPMPDLPDYTETIEDNTSSTSQPATSTPPKPGGEITPTGLLNVLHTFIAVGVPFGTVLSRAVERDNSGFGPGMWVTDLMTGVLVVSLVFVVLVGVEAGCAWVWNAGMRRVSRSS